MKEVDILQEQIVVECTVQCTKCRKTQVDMQTDEFYFADELMEGGWRATKNNVYCPECAKKHLKSNK